MSRVVFRNYDIITIKSLLKEIGEKHYEGALQEQNIEQKPLSMKGFLLNMRLTLLM